MSAYKRSLQRIINAQRRILDDAEAENRTKLNDDEQAEYDLLEAEWERTYDPQGARRRCLDSLPEHEARGGSGDIHDMERPIDRNEYDEEVRALGSFVRGESRSLMKDKDIEGGFAVVPVNVNNQMLHDLDNTVVIRKLGRIFPVTKADSIGIPIMDSDIQDPTFKGEIGESDLDSEMKLGRRDLHPNRCTVGIKWSRTLANLSSANLVSFIVERGTYKMQVVMENNFLNGSGSGQPLGIFTTSDLGVDSGRDVSEGNTTTSIKYDGLVNCYYNLKSQYLQSPAIRWIFSRPAIKMIRKLKDGEGMPLWQPGMQAGEPPRILGVPVITSEYAPSDFSSGKRVGMLCDLRFYGIAEYENMQVQTLVEKYALTNQNATLFQHFFDGTPMIANAFSAVTLA
jgi:HK97 family phage major capsid protein